MTWQLRTMQRGDWDEVACLIHKSLNAWYLKNRGFELVAGAWETLRIFPEVYEGIDPGSCLIAEEKATKKIVGQCFYHRRPTHIAVGIVSVDPAWYGRGVARGMMDEVIRMSEAECLPLRLVSSAMNLDSFTLYNKAGFRPLQFFQDMIWTVPDSGVSVPRLPHATVRDATSDDVAGMVALERRLVGLDREHDLRYFLANREKIWGLSVCLTDAGEVRGWLASVRSPGSTMLGPGVVCDEDEATSLVCHRLDAMRGSQVVWLVRSDCTALTSSMYKLGARNCETHVTQCRPCSSSPNVAIPQGIVFPTFMPETG
ncbi:MAG: GNAT family N-acetyltransferase [Thermoguttaceae bacterium]